MTFLCVHRGEAEVEGHCWLAPCLVFFTPAKDQVPIVLEAWWTLGSVQTNTENLSPTWVRSLDPPACSKSPYWLRYPGCDTGEHSYIIIWKQLLLQLVYLWCTCHLFGNVMCIWWHFTFVWCSGESRSWDSSVTVMTNKDNGLNEWKFIFWQRQGGFVLHRS